VTDSTLVAFLVATLIRSFIRLAESPLHGAGANGGPAAGQRIVRPAGANRLPGVSTGRGRSDI